MDDEKVAEIQSHLVRRLPDCRITTYFDAERDAQRFKIRHGRIATHVLFVEDAAVHRYSRDELTRLLDRAVDRFRQTGQAVQLVVGPSGIHAV